MLSADVTGANVRIFRVSRVRVSMWSDIYWVSLKADRTTAQSDHCAVVRSDHANYDRRALIICR